MAYSRGPRSVDTHEIVFQDAQLPREPIKLQLETTLVTASGSVAVDDGRMRVRLTLRRRNTTDAPLPVRVNAYVLETSHMLADSLVLLAPDAQTLNVDLVLEGVMQKNREHAYNKRYGVEVSVHTWGRPGMTRCADRRCLCAQREPTA